MQERAIDEDYVAYSGDGPIKLGRGGFGVNASPKEVESSPLAKSPPFTEQPELTLRNRRRYICGFAEYAPLSKRRAA